MRYKSLPFEELSRRQQRKVVINEQCNRCNVCGNEFVWLGIFLVPHIHHKNGNKKDKTRKNIEALCPNCHSQTKNYGYKNVSNEVRQKHSKNIVASMKLGA
jgi:5-methylcytosine-specific restriction endonuclease McrA